MTTKTPEDYVNELRQRAEKSASEDSEPEQESFSPELMQSLLHDLRVHQIELEMQNEELRRVQQELEVSRARYFELYNLAPVGYLTLDENGLILEANLTVATLLGVERSALLKRPLSSYIFPEDQDIYYLQRKRLLETGTPQTWEMRMLHSDGSIFQMQLQATPAIQGELRITLEDITELWRARQDVLKTQKIDSLGILAGGIAHDFNNILAAILGNISLARMQVYEPEKALTRLVEAEKATDRAKQLAKQLLTFAKGGEPVKKTIDVRAILQEAAGFAMLGSNVRCVLSLSNDLRPVEADEGQISQVIHNLVLNAVHAMPEGGTVTVSAENVSSSQSGKSFVKFSVTDTGTGIPKQNLAKIFDPYFTTKTQGSGLGLATSFSIIKKHGGKIRVESLEGMGSTFTISIPASEQNHSSVSNMPNELTQGYGDVLVMDDDEMIRNISQALLEELGYKVECVENGSEALNLYLKRKEQGRPFFAVILDLIIPGGLGGLETIKKLLESDPGVKAIACSGYSTDPVVANYRDYGFRAALCKPFYLQELNDVMYALQKE